MNRKLLLLVFFCINALIVSAQQLEVKGTIRDASTKELLIAANVTYAPSKGTVTDIDGNYTLQLDSGNYELTISYVGYTTLKQIIKVVKNMRVDFVLELSTLNMVEKTADIAKTRETPIAFTNISQKKISEELGSRDLPMILNSTPGVYATEKGGGSGDAQVTIRGFDQTNVAVLVDGIPVNDMESGAVFWSNWDGLGDVTASVQVQRGLGASKLGIPSVGGTMNLITKGIESKARISVKQEVGNDDLLKTTLGLTSGRLKGGWGITLAGSRKTGNGWVDLTFTDAWSYFIKIQKELGKHLISAGANGAPQKHGQRTDYLPIYVLDKDYAEKIGLNPDNEYHNSPYTKLTHDDRGLRFNSKGGLLKDDEDKINTAVNYYHKPIFNLSDYWTVNKKFFVSNVAYLSIGNGGGANLNNTSLLTDSATGLLDLQPAYKDNIVIKSADKNYSTTEPKSSVFLQSNENNHFWYGLLSSFNYDLNPKIDVSGGIDLRSYNGYHITRVYDMLGGSYVIDKSNKNQPDIIPGDYSNAPYAMKRKDDIIGRNYDGFVRWGAGFAQVEYKTSKLSTFISGSFSETGYKRVDHFARKDVVLTDTTLQQVIGWGQTLLYNGNEQIVYNSAYQYRDSVSNDTTFLILNSNSSIKDTIVNAQSYTIDSPEAKTSSTDWKWFVGYTIKAGANYNINQHHNIYMNAGFLSLAPHFTNVFTFSNKEYDDIENQRVESIELGYGYKSSIFSSNLNLYYTSWKNKPYSRSNFNLGGDFVNFNINGINELHKGVEGDFIFKPVRKIAIEGLISYGDWVYSSSPSVYITNDANTIDSSLNFYAKGVHVGGSAQIQYGGSVRYEPFKHLYVKGQLINFSKYYSEFNPLDLQDDGVHDYRNHESWKIPSYYLVDFYSGYFFKYGKFNFDISLAVFNLLNKVYIADARNNGNVNPSPDGFDAASATVFIGQGRRFNTSLKITFE